MKTRISLLYLLLFAVANVLLFLLHRYLFQSFMPMLAWVAVFLHVVALIFFPYHKLTVK